MMPACNRPALIALAALLLPAAAGGTSFVPIRDAALADGAPVIVEGRILAVEPASGERPAIDYLVEIEHMIKGAQPGGTLVMRVPGGVRPDGIGLLLRGMPRFGEGDEALLFLEPRQGGTFGLHQLMLGAFHITAEGDARVAARDLSGALRAPAEGAPADGPRDAALFRRWLAGHVAGRAPAADYFLPAAGAYAGALAHKFWTIVSTDDPPPFGCGEDGGHRVRWFDFASGPDGISAGEVSWRAHYHGQDGVPDGGIDAFRRALAAWTDDPNTSINLAFGGLTAATGGLSANDGVNAVLFGDPEDEIGGSFDGEGLLALGGPWFDCATLLYQGERFHPILAADIVTQDGLELFFASTPDPANAAEQLFAHELGHTLGLAHSEDAEALMFGLFHPDRRGAALAVDDLAGALYLYGPRDLTPPAAPFELTATESGGRVLLAWTDGSDNESGFRIERRQAGSFELVTTAAADATSFIDSGIEPLTLYAYRVQAHNGAGASAYTAIAEILTGQDPRPAAPTNLRAAPLSSTEIRLAWQDNSDDETGFLVEILIPPDWVQIPVQLPPDTRKVIVEGLPPASSLSFRLKAVNAFGISKASNQAGAATFDNDQDCVVTGEQLCLLGGRFKVSADFRSQYAGGIAGSATVVPSTDETGLLWFFSPDNVELIVKVLDGRHINQHFWLFYGALSDLEYRVTVTDTATGQTEVYHNAPGEVCGRADTAAFPGEPAESDPPPQTATPEKRNSAVSVSLPFGVSTLRLRPVPEAAAPPVLKSGSCQPGPQTLCLLDRRLRVEVSWQNPHGSQAASPGRAIADSDTTGMFWFFNLENIELVIKALDGGALNGHLWIFYGALTDLEYWLTVTDTGTGESRVYYSPAGEACGRADTWAFPADPLVGESPED